MLKKYLALFLSVAIVFQGLTTIHSHAESTNDIHLSVSDQLQENGSAETINFTLSNIDGIYGVQFKLHVGEYKELNTVTFKGLTMEEDSGPVNSQDEVGMMKKLDDGKYLIAITGKGNDGNLAAPVSLTFETVNTYTGDSIDTSSVEIIDLNVINNQNNSIDISSNTKKLTANYYVESSSYKAKVEAYKSSVAALPAVDEVDLTNTSAIEEIRSNYDELRSLAGDYFNLVNLDETVVIAYENKLTQLVEALEDAINGFDEVDNVTISDEDAIDNLKARYDGLSVSQKALIADEAKTKLSDMIAQIDILESLVIQLTSAKGRMIEELNDHPEGTNAGNASAEARAALQNAISELEAVLAEKDNKTKTEFTSALAAANEAIKVFEAAVITDSDVLRDELNLVINNAMALFNGAQAISDGILVEGHYYQVDIDTFNENIEEGKVVRDNENASNTMLYTAITALQDAIYTFQQQAISKVDVAQKDLSDAINEAQQLINSAEYGNGENQVPLINKYILLDAIDVAENVLLYSNDVDEINQAKAVLVEAKGAFQQAVITKIDLLQESVNNLFADAGFSTLKYSVTLDGINGMITAINSELDSGNYSNEDMMTLNAIKDRAENAKTIYTTPVDILLYSDTSLSYVESGTAIHVSATVWNAINKELSENITVQYTSNNESVAAFIEDGQLEANDEGVTTITATVAGTDPAITTTKVVEVYSLPDMIISNISQGAKFSEPVTVTAYRDAYGTEIRIINNENDQLLVSGDQYVTHTFTAEGNYTVRIESGTKNTTNYNEALLTFSIDLQLPMPIIPAIEDVENQSVTIPSINFGEEGLKKENLYLEKMVEGAYIYLRNVIAGDVITAAGDYRLVAYAMDEAGNENMVSEAFKIDVDEERPVISVTGIQDINSSTVTPTISLTGGSNQENYYYIADVIMPSGQIITKNSMDSGADPLAFTASGQYSMFVRAYNPNAMHLAATYEKDFAIDLNNPTLTITGVSENGFYNYNVTPLIIIADSDNLLNANELFEHTDITFTRNGVPMTYTNGTTLIKEGDYLVKATITDLAGKSATESVSFTIDKTSPQLDITGATDGHVYHEDVALSFTTDTENLVVKKNGVVQSLGANNSLTLTGVEGASTVYLIEAAVNDQAGNKTVKQITITIDLLPVTFTVTGIYEGQIVNALPAPNSMTCLVQDGAEEHTITPTIVEADDDPYSGASGAHKLQLSYSKGDNTYTKEINFIIDHTGPEISGKTTKLDDQIKDTSFLARKGNVLLIEVNVEDDETAIREVYAKIGHLTTSLPMIPTETANQYAAAYNFGEGNFADLDIKVVATNEAGLSTETTLNYVTLDNTAPIVNYHVTPVNLPDGQNGYFTASDTKVVLTTTDQTATIKYVLNDNAVSDYSVPIALSEGVNVLSYYAVDDIGNTSDTRIRVIKFDPTAPSIPINMTPADGILSVPIVTIEGKVASEAGKESSVIVKQNNLTIAKVQIGEEGRFTIPDINLSEGENILVINAVDKAGNMGPSTNKILTVDTTKPVFAVIKDGNTYTATSNEVIHSELEATFNGNAIAPQSGGIGQKVFTYTVDANDVIEGKNEFVIYGTDQAGNIGSGSLSTNYIPPAQEQNDVPVMEGTNIDIPAGTFDSITLLTVQTVDVEESLGYKPLGSPILYEFTEEPNQPIIIKTYVGTHLTGVGLVHIDDNGTAGDFLAAIVGTMDMDNLVEDQPYYDPVTGMLVYRTANFSTYQQVQDNTKPEITITTVDFEINAADTASIEGTITDQDAAAYIDRIIIDGAIKDVHLQSPFSYNLDLSDGSHDISVVARDSAGNTRTITSTYNVDRTAPVISVNGPSTTNQDHVEVQFKTSEEVTVLVNAKSYGVKTNGDTLDLQLQQASNAFTIVASDGFGNKATKTLTIQRVERVDLTVDPVTDTEDSSIAITGSINVQGDIYINDVLKLEDAPAGNFTIPNVSLAMGDNTFEIKVIDGSGYQDSEMIIVKRTPVIVNLTISPVAETTSAAVSITGTINVPGDIYIDNQLKLSNASGNFTVTNVPLVIGNNTFVIKAVHASGSNDTVTITIKRKEADTGGNSGGGGDPGVPPTGSTESDDNQASNGNIHEEHVVSSSGGKMTFGKTNVDMVIPDTAFSQKTKVEVEVFDPNNIEKEGLITLGYVDSDEKLELTGKVYAFKAASPFNKTLLISIPVEVSDDFSDYHKLGVYQYNDDKGTWEFVGGKYNKATKKMEVELEHFSYYCVMTYEKTFTDIATSWAKDYITHLASMRIVNGTPQNAYKPNTNITRAAFVKMLVSVAGLDNTNTHTIFSDVPSHAWYAGYVKAAYDAGLVSGYMDKTFRPNNNISRDEMVVMTMNLYTYVTKKDYTILYDGDNLAFSDSSLIKNWAKDAVKGAVELGIISGKPNNLFDPKNNATRAEAAKVIKVLMDIME